MELPGPLEGLTAIDRIDGPRRTETLTPAELQVLARLA
jgi:hypothetical protein